MTAKKIIVANVAVSSCVFSALDCPETLPKWEPLEKFELCNGLHKRAGISARMSDENINKP